VIDERRLLDELLLIELQELEELELCRADPVRLMSHMVGVDQRSGESFDFSHLRDPLAEGEIGFDPVWPESLRPAERTWRWQRFLAERVLRVPRLILLKGRQIGATWVVLGADVAEALTQPGTTSLLFRQREDEAVDNVRRWWVLYNSLPEYLRMGTKVIRPSTAVQPGRDGVALQFPGGAISEVVPMSSAKASGHGRSVRRVIADEAAYIELLEDIMAAVEPAAGKAAINLISTANGRSNPETGAGNEYHRRWEDRDSGYERLFLGYDVHPDRDQEWYETASEIRALKPHQRAAQFPRNPDEAFELSNRVFFDPEDLAWYRDHAPTPLRRIEFEKADSRSARVRERDKGWITVYVEPVEGHSYAIGADVATGRGADYSAATVVDLSNMEIVADFHGKLDSDQYAYQLHYLGKRYNTALLAVETSGGFGEAVIIPLRDGREGRPAYPKLYRHVMSSRPSLDVAKVYGFPTNQKTRPLILNQLEKSMRPDEHGERVLPWLPAQTVHEMGDFIYHDTGASPRARDGARDDRVMCTAIALEMYRLRGSHADRPVQRIRSRRLYRGLGRSDPAPRSSSVDSGRYPS
jgi:hypothetical protein